MEIMLLIDLIQRTNVIWRGKWNLWVPILQTEDSKFRRGKSHYTWWTYFTRAATTRNVLCHKTRNLLFILFIIAKLLYGLIYQLPKFPSRAIIVDPFTRSFTTINTYFYFLCQYYIYSQRQGSVGYPHQDSIWFHKRFHRANLKRDS